MAEFNPITEAQASFTGGEDGNRGWRSSRAAIEAGTSGNIVDQYKGDGSNAKKTDGTSGNIVGQGTGGHITEGDSGNFGTSGNRAKAEDGTSGNIVSIGTGGNFTELGRSGKAPVIELRPGAPVALGSETRIKAPTPVGKTGPRKAA